MTANRKDIGHSYSNCRNLWIDRWGGGPFVISVDNAAHFFEDCARFGPLRVNADGEQMDPDFWPTRHPFLAAHHAWVVQGRRLAPDGKTCVYDPLRPMRAWT